MALPLLTRPEQHCPVESRGLGGAPCPLAQPLRHASAPLTAERALRARSARWSAVRGWTVSAAVTRLQGQKPTEDRVTAGILTPGTEAPLGEGRGGGGKGSGRCPRPGSWQGAGERLVGGLLAHGSRSKVGTGSLEFQLWSPTYSSFP